MSEIMTYERWMKFTDGGYTSIRSSQLKAIDTALKRYHQTKKKTDQDALCKAIVAWMQKEGPRWETSVRNRYFAVDDLHKQSMGLPTPPRSDRETIAFYQLRAESRVIVNHLFRGKSLTWKPGYFTKLANQKVGTVTNTYTVTNSSLMVAGKTSAPKFAQEVFQSIVPAHSAGEVSMALAQVMPNFMTELTTSMIPFAGVAITGGVAAWNTVKTAFSQYDLSQARMHQSRNLCVGDPAAAISALVRILERERNYNATSASISGTAFAGKLVTILADGGTASNAAIGLAAGAAKLINIVRVILRDVLEKREANRRMQMDVNAEIFDVCPIVGAYLILCVPTSVMVNTVFDRMMHGENGWRGDVERTVTRHLVPLQNEARRVISDGRFEITALNRYPGMLSVNKNKLAQMQAWKEWRDRHPERRMDAQAGPNLV